MYAYMCIRQQRERKERFRLNMGLTSHRYCMLGRPKCLHFDLSMRFVFVSQADEAWKAAYSKPGRKLLVEKYKKTEVKGHIRKEVCTNLQARSLYFVHTRYATIRTNTNRVRYTRDHSRVIRVTGRFGRVRRQRERGTPVKEQESPSRDLTLAPHFPALLLPPQALCVHQHYRETRLQCLSGTITNHF